MNKSIVLISIACALSVGGCVGDPPPADVPTAQTARACDYPTKEGRYEKDGWKYIFEGDTFSESQSAICSGRLFKDGKEIQGQIREVIDTPLGKFMFCAGAYNKGWLNTCTYKVRIFDEEGNVIQR